MDITLLYKIAGFIIASRVIDHILDKSEKLPGNLPVDELLALTDFFGQQHQIVCLGDTFHGDIYIQALLESPDLGRGLAEQGFRKEFIERPTREQDLIDRLYDGWITKTEFVDQLIKNKFVNSYLGNNIGKQLAGQLAEMIAESGMPLRAIDHRWEGLCATALYNQPVLIKAAYLSAAFACFGAKLCFPKSSLASRVLCEVIGLCVKYNHEFWNYAFDDSTSAGYIDSFMRYAPGEKAIVVYGAGHFNGMADNFGVRGMRSWLEEYGLNPAVINIFPNFKERGKYYRRAETNPHFLSPHADFIIRPEARGPHIVFTRTREETAFRDFQAQAPRAAAPARTPLAAPSC